MMVAANCSATTLRLFAEHLLPVNFGQAFPESVSCSVTSGSTYVTISCQAEKVFPGQIVCVLQNITSKWPNSTDAFLGKTSGTGTLQSGYYKSSCSLSTVEVSWGLNQYFVNVRNPLAPSGEGLNSTTVNLYANTVTLTGFNIGSPTGFLQCQTSPAPAQVIRITRRGLGTEVATSYNTSLLTYNMANASCLDLDEYVCEANEVKAYFHLVVTCSPRLVDNVNNETYSRKIGSTVLIPPIVVSSTAPPSVFILLYNEEGVTYQARSEMFKAYYVARSLYFGTVNLAIYDLTEGDYRSYAFYIRSGSAEGAAVYFALSQESSDVTDYKPAVIALGILFAIFALVVVVFTVVYLCHRCRRRGPRQERSQPAPVTFSNTALVAGGEFYDSMSTPESDNDHYGQVSGLPSSRQAQDTTYVNAEVLPDLKQNRWKTSDPETYGNADQIKKHYSSMKQK
ncbi:hypothetical protein Btru_055992 [Bulinus truncatus]|nr:hypothetical protein Btru_055992 [Bulinus truncatus]